MADLDALLDDLHNTSQQHARQDPYQQQQQQQQQEYHSSSHYQNMYHDDQPIYEPQNILNTTAVIETTVYKTPPPSLDQSPRLVHATPTRVDQSGSLGRAPPTRVDQSGSLGRTPPPSYKECFQSPKERHQVERHYSTESRGQDQNRFSDRGQDLNRGQDLSRGQDHSRVSLRSNLSELDNMLEDLNSANFLTEVDKRSREAHSPYANIQRATPPREYQEPRSNVVHVDRMLSDLEREAERNRENAQYTRYEKRTVTTTRTYNDGDVRYSESDVRSYSDSSDRSGDRLNQSGGSDIIEPVAPSNATRELDDLMASLSEFNMKPMPPGQVNQVPLGQVPQNQVHPGQVSQNQVHGQVSQNTSVSAPVNDPPYAVSTKVTRTVSSKSEPPRSPLSRDGSVTRLDTPVRNVVPDIQVQSSSYANVVDSPDARVRPDSGGYNQDAYTGHYVNAPNEGRGDKLDVMLGQLDSDMQRHGVTTVQKGHCAACNKPIVGQVITALGKIWHPDHFCCAHCNNELGTMTFFERDGKPYCEEDYHALFSPRCYGCNGPILDRCVTGLGQTWHPEHFCCAHCGRPFDDEGFHEKEGKPYCREDYFDMFAPKCGGCLQAIIDNYISALNKQWHPECFICQDCHMPFSGGSFFEHEGMPFCETHYHAKRGSLCAGCQKPITGRCITAMYRKFHPEHFVCAFCLKQLNKGTFKEQNDKPYCHSCFVKLFG